MNRFSLDDLFRPPPSSPSSPLALLPVQFPEALCCYVAGQPALKCQSLQCAPAFLSRHFSRLPPGKVLTALDFLQRQRRLAHGNVKGSNVLVSSNGEVKLNDMQSCKNLREEFRQSSLSIVSSSRGLPSDKRFRCSMQRLVVCCCPLCFVHSPFICALCEIVIIATLQGARIRLFRPQTSEPRHMERGHLGGRACCGKAAL
jgi:hypothetical protein